MGILYAKNSKIYCNDYMEIYIPTQYFDAGLAVNEGNSILSFGVVYTRAFPNGKEEPIRLMNISTKVRYMIYDSKQETIQVKGKLCDVLTLKYLKDSYVLHQTIVNGREIGEQFLASMVEGKLPSTIDYAKLIDLWWTNLNIAGISFKVPSKIYEMIIATVYRDPRNVKRRYGQYYASSATANGYDYKTGNARSSVKNLSTFSGIAFEDMGDMITNGISNSLQKIEEPESPLEKIIHY